MKMIILAAGSGTRLRPLTNDRPKCLVTYQGYPLIEYILSAADHCGIDDIVVVGGYRADTLRRYLSDRPVRFYINTEFNNTNMVNTLFCAEPELRGDIILSYSDIIYSKEILTRMISSSADIAVAVDTAWEDLWRIRMENPLADAETMKIDDRGRIIELGKPASRLSDIQAQYIGLIRLSASAVEPVRRFYRALDTSAAYDGASFNNMYMTTFIQLIIDRLMPVEAVRINGGWLEFDSIQDMDCYAAHRIDIDTPTAT